MKYVLIAILIYCLTQISCSDDDSVVHSGPVETSEAESAFVSGGDITNALATNRSGDCTTYANTYTSNITDLTTGRDFSGAVAITVIGNKCVISSNGIPKHDMGEGASFPNQISEVNQRYEIQISPTIASNRISTENSY